MMRVFFDWLRRLVHVAGLTSGPGRHGFVVERLEPRQMLAADCFFILEVFPAGAASDERFAEESYAVSWGSEEASWNEAPPPAVASSERSLFDDYEEYYLVHLEDVLDEIGELYEIRETSFGDFDYGDFPWFS